MDAAAFAGWPSVLGQLTEGQDLDADTTQAALGEVLGRPSWLRVPRTGLKVAMGSEAAESIGYSSIRLDPAQLRAAGFTWEHPDLTPALHSLLG